MAACFLFSIKNINYTCQRTKYVNMRMMNFVIYADHLVSLQQCNLEDLDGLGMYHGWMKNVYRILVGKCLRSNHMKNLKYVGRIT